MWAGALRAEWIKLTSTRAPFWCLGVVILLGLGLSLLITIATRGGTGGGPDAVAGLGAADYLTGVNFFGVVVLMIMAVLAITTEYRFGTIRASFLAVPRRPLVLCAKAVIYGVLTVVVVALLSTASLLLVLAVSDGASGLRLDSELTLRQIWGTPIWAALCVLVGLGVGALIRHTAGAISIVLVWMLVVENILGALPVIGRRVGPFLPFQNGSRFLSGDVGDYHWNSWVSLGYFALFSALIFVAGIMVMNSRDA